MFNFRLLLSYIYYNFRSYNKDIQYAGDCVVLTIYIKDVCSSPTKAILLIHSLNKNSFSFSFFVETFTHQL